MTRLLEFEGDDGRPILVEVEAAGDDGPLTRGLRPPELVTKATESLDGVLGRIRPVVSSIASDLRDAVEGPDEVEIEFSVKLSADANVIIARTATEATFRIRVLWSRQAAG